MTSNYSYRNLDNGISLCREDALPLLLKATKLVFDCDGVIVSDFDSYREAIVRSVDYYFLKLLSLEGEERHLVTKEDVQRMKDTGAFNNDWKLTYAMIAYYLGLILRRLQGEVKAAESGDMTERSRTDLDSLLERLRSLSDRTKRLGVDIAYLEGMKSNLTSGLNQLLEAFAQKADLDILKEIGKILGLKAATLETMRSLCPFSIHGDDLLRRLFDEIYLGKVLYTKFTGKTPFFGFAEGLIDREERIPSMDTMERLKFMFGLFAMYSERPRNEGLYILQKHDLLDYFDRRATFFSEDIMRICKSDNPSVIWGKPNARAFVTLLDTFCEESDVTAYVGDTVSDALMIRNARNLTPRNQLFVGTLSSSPREKKLENRYMELGVELIVKDANLIPAAFDRIGK